MPFNINHFRSAINNDIVRAHQFEVLMPFPNWASVNSDTGQDLRFFCKSTVIPAHDIGVVDVPYWGGRKIQLAGDRSGNDWNITIISDAKYQYRRMFEKWQNGISQHKQNYRIDEADTSGVGGGYMVDAIVDHYGQAGPGQSSFGFDGESPIPRPRIYGGGNVRIPYKVGGGVTDIIKRVLHLNEESSYTILRSYKLVGVWPLQISNIDLSWETTDAYEEFQVSLKFQWVETVDWEASVPAPISDATNRINSITQGLNKITALQQKLR